MIKWRNRPLGNKLLVIALIATLLFFLVSISYNYVLYRTYSEKFNNLFKSVGYSNKGLISSYLHSSFNSKELSLEFIQNFTRYLWEHVILITINTFVLITTLLWYNIKRRFRLYKEGKNNNEFK